MRTAHLTTLTTSFSPFNPISRTPRLFLTLLPPNAHNRIKITQKVLPRGSPLPAVLELGFKDGKQLKYLWDEVAVLERDVGIGGESKKEKRIKLQDIVEEVERHERMLARKEELSG